MKGKTPPTQALRFADFFAGCGGLSLGLMNAGLEGAFAIERNPDAFGTLHRNLLAGERLGFEWPTWLPMEPIEIASFIKKYKREFQSLSGHLDVIAGGPPCQGFSMAGKRDQNDPRNRLFE